MRPGPKVNTFRGKKAKEFKSNTVENCGNQTKRDVPYVGRSWEDSKRLKVMARDDCGLMPPHRG